MRQIQHLASIDHAVELTKAYEAGRQVAITDSWIAGAKVGGICCLLIGLAVGCAGGMFWVRLGWLSA